MHPVRVSFIFILLLCGGCSDNRTTKSSQSNSYLRMAAAGDPLSLDPRLVRDLDTANVMQMLYEGLMSTNSDGKIIPGIAESYTISKDKKTYTFHLRSSTWSDGSMMTAQDFEQTWKSILSPAFPAPNAYQLYLIKGAKAAKEGLISVEKIGVHAPDDVTLIVQLVQPAPYFLEMVSCHFYFPVHASLRNKLNEQVSSPITNGPFKLEKWTQRSEVKLAKNAAYWNAKNLKLAGISLQILDEHTALQLFKAGELDWAGSPLSTLPQDAITPLKQQNKLQIAPGDGTQWFRLNTSKPPFNNEKMRRAFALALDRKAIVEHVTQGNQYPATGIVPPSFGLAAQNYFVDRDLNEAQKLFKESLADTHLTKDDLPAIVLSYASNDRNHKISQAVQQQWNQAFGINIVLSGNESHMQLDKVKNGNYEISLGSWYADIHDPINFLEIFKSKDNPTNQTFWENEAYAALLDHSSLELNPEKRLQILAKAEKILIQNMPVIPLFHTAYNYLKSNRVESAYFSMKEATLTDQTGMASE